MTKPRKIGAGKYPQSRVGWHDYYAKQFSKYQTEQSEQLACWYLFLHLAFD